MPATLTYPGVYIEEVPSGVRTITGVATAITAFIGRASRGPVPVSLPGEPVIPPTQIQSFAAYERTFGGLWRESSMSYAVQQFFLHGGKDALIIRVHNAAAPATISLSPTPSATLEAANPGAWGNALQAIVDHDTKDPVDNTLFNLTIRELSAPGSDEPPVAAEVFLNLSTDATSSRFVSSVLEQESSLVRVQGNVTARPDASPLDVDGDPIPTNANQVGTDGALIDGGDVIGDTVTRTGLYALDAADLFNLLCIPSPVRGEDVDPATWAEAAAYCRARRALLIVDPPYAWNEGSDVTNPTTGVDGTAGGLRPAIGTDNARNAALYFPHLRMADALNENRTETFVPCGAVAGIIARTDAQRGVWKAPAGTEASFTGVREFRVKLTDGENGLINPLGVNALRTFPVTGHVVWGARTLAGADRLASEWKYVPVRRLALYIEESLYRGTQWVVFEPNDEPLWSQIRLNVGAFMQGLFRQGAFQGKTPREAYFVQCDGTTTTQNDINLGIVNVLVGFAPLKPAEFVVIKIQQMAGQVEA